MTIYRPHSAASSPASADSTSASSSLASSAAGRSNSTPSPAPSSSATGPTSDATTISGPGQPQTPSSSTSSSEGSLASRSASPARASRKPTPGGSGPSSDGWLPGFAPRGSSSRTCRDCGAVACEECWPTLPLSGSMRSGQCSAHEMSVPRTSASASSSLLPTPVASSYGSNRGGSAGRVGKSRPSLETMPRSDLWPTPTVKGNYNRRGSSPTSGDGLQTAVNNYPTPTASRRTGLQSHGVNVISGTLNPTWVEWLMGFPLGWTACARWEMQSSRRRGK